jgi:hypothetical protein
MLHSLVELVSWNRFFDSLKVSKFELRTIYKSTPPHFNTCTTGAKLIFKLTRIELGLELVPVSYNYKGT